MTPALAIVPKPDRPQSLAQRIAELQAGLRTLNAEQVAALSAILADAINLAGEVAANPTQPAGIRDVARRLAEDIDSRAQTIRAISERI